MPLDAVRGRSGNSRPLTGTLGGTEPGFGLIVNREAPRPLLRALPGPVSSRSGLSADHPQL
ncbi:hypothetical protein ABZ235_10090 [Streptomyces canus]|uniref:hypothetical protein n=1 Tax=Streptomyces canus TaxID=58343 RepID=UPI0033BF81F1